MSENVSRLKELLFDGEARALADLARRVELVATSGEQQRREMATELARQIEQRARGLAHESANNTSEIQRLDELVHALRQTAEANVKDSRETAQRLEALAQSLKQLADQGQTQNRELMQQLEAVTERAGSDQRLEASVARVVDGALRRAEVDKHVAVSDAMAPLVVRTIKTEIRNSQDELVEALYPMTGRMVKAYVASAMADLMQQIDRKLKSNPLMLRLKSLTTGRSMAELALSETQALAIEEVYLIRRGTGELLGRWPDAPARSNRDQVMSGVLTAINDFSAEAFKEDGSALRHIDLEASQVFLRASPTYLLAVRCSGQAHADIERIIDDEFLVAIERHHDMLAAEEAGTAPAGGAQPSRSAYLGDLAGRLVRRVDEKQEELSRPAFGLSPLRLAVLFIGLPLAAWAGWIASENFKTARVRSVAQRVIETSTEIKGYPVTLDVEPWGRALTVSGLTPSNTAREDVVTRLHELLPATEIRDQLSVVPTGGVDTRPQIALVRNELSRLELETQRAAMTRALDRTRLRLEQTLPDLAALRETSDHREAQTAVARAIATVEHLTATLTAHQKRLAERSMRTTDFAAMKAGLEETSRELASASTEIMALLGGTPQAATTPPPSKRATAIEAAEEMATQAERLASTAIAVHQANIIGRRPPPERIIVQPAPPPPAPPPPAPREPSAIERLADLLRTNVVWFGNQTDFRDDDKARALLDDTTRLAKESGVLLRVVGFTDEQGSSALNTQLALSRARRVADELVARGLPRERIVTIGRPGFEISPTRGPRSANRRVEIQIGFEGEEAE